jgi:hypothetical protein
MKNIKTYESFCDETNEEINLKKALAGVALATGMAFNTPATAQVTTPTQQEINSSTTYKGNFKWEKMDSVSKTKAQIYTDTKMFISEAWKSAKNVIQNDDKDGGVILVKGSISKNALYKNKQNFEYIYNYNITFKMKDGKYKISIDNVTNTMSILVGYSNISIPYIQPFDAENCPDNLNKIAGPGKESLSSMMESLKQDLQSIIDSYEKYIKNPANTASSDW